MSRLAITNAVRRRIRAWVVLCFFTSIYMFIILPLSLRHSQRTQLAAYTSTEGFHSCNVGQLRPVVVAILDPCLGRTN